MNCQCDYTYASCFSLSARLPSRCRFTLGQALSIAYLFQVLFPYTSSSATIASLDNDSSWLPSSKKSGKDTRSGKSLGTDVLSPSKASVSGASSAAEASSTPAPDFSPAPLVAQPLAPHTIAPAVVQPTAQFSAPSLVGGDSDASLDSIEPYVS